MESSKKKKKKPDLGLPPMEEKYVPVGVMAEKYDIGQALCVELAASVGALRKRRGVNVIDVEVFEEHHRDRLRERQKGKILKEIAEDPYVVPVAKAYMRYEEAAEFFSMSLTTFKPLVKAAGARRKVGRVALVNVDIVARFIEEHCKGDEYGVSGVLDRGDRDEEEDLH